MNQLEIRCMEKDLRNYFKKRLPKHLDVLIKIKSVTFDAEGEPKADTHEVIYCAN